MYQCKDCRHVWDLPMYQQPYTRVQNKTIPIGRYIKSWENNFLNVNGIMGKMPCPDLWQKFVQALTIATGSSFVISAATERLVMIIYCTNWIYSEIKQIRSSSNVVIIYTDLIHSFCCLALSDTHRLFYCIKQMQGTTSCLFNKLRMYFSFSVNDHD